MLDIEDITGSIQNSQLMHLPYDVKFFYDTEGRIKHFTGGYAVIYPCECCGRKKVIRCWHTPIIGSDERYKIIAKDFTESRLNFLVPFEYHVSSLMVNGVNYPYMITEWIDGENIKNFVFDNKTNKKLLSTLARRFLVLCAEMNGRMIAHGDLQHGNILVSADGRLFLIDYDSVWTYGMGTSVLDQIKGLAAYQHPCRKNNRYAFGGIDIFPQLTIYLSILAVMHDPSLADIYCFEKSEHMLFSKEDFSDWRHSKVRDDLCRIMNEEIDYLVATMDGYLKYDDISFLQPFYHF